MSSSGMPSPMLFKPHATPSTPHLCNMLALQRLYNDPKFSDAILKVGTSQVHVSKLILSRSSEYFYKLFFGGFQNASKEIELHDDDEQSMEIMLEYIYGKGYTLSQAESFAVHAKTYAVAEKYDIGGLRECVTMVMRDKLERYTGCPAGPSEESNDPRADPNIFDTMSDEEIDAMVEHEREIKADRNAQYEDFYDAVKIVYTFTTEKDRLVRPMLASICAKHAYDKGKEKSDITALIREFPDLGLDLFHVAYAGNERKVMLWVCGRCDRVQEAPQLGAPRAQSGGWGGWDDGPIIPTCKGCHESVATATGEMRGALKSFTQRDI